jgi:hypothetical protein
VLAISVSGRAATDYPDGEGDQDQGEREQPAGLDPLDGQNRLAG